MGTEPANFLMVKHVAWMPQAEFCARKWTIAATMSRGDFVC